MNSTPSAVAIPDIANILDTVPDAYVCLDSEFRYTFLNRASEQLLGEDRADLLGKVLWDVRPALVGTPFGENCRRAMTERVPVTFEDHDEQRQRWYKFIATPDSEGGIMVRTVDISDRKRAEERIEKTLMRQWGVSRLHRALLAPAPLEDQLREVADAIVSLFDADFCRIWLIRPGDLCERGCIHAEVHDGPHVCRHRDRCLHLLTSSGRYTHIDGPAHRRVPFGCYKIGRVASNEDPKFVTNDVQNDPGVHDHAWASALGLVSFAGYQLRTPGEETLGVLALFAKHPILADDDAMLNGLASTVAMVVKRAAAEETLRQSEKHFRQLVTHAGEGIGFVDSEERFQFANPAAETIFGVPPNGLAGRSLTEFLSPEEYRRVQEATANRRNGLEDCYELEILRPDGAVRQVLLTAVPDLSGKGRFMGTFGVFHDITERKRAEEALRDSQDRHRTILQTAMEGFWLVDMQGRLLEVNEAYCRMSGYSAEELTAMRISDLKDSAGTEDMATHIKRVMAQGEDRFESRHRRKDGSAFDVAVSIQYRPAEGGRFVAFLRDITVRKRAEESLLRRTGELAQANTDLERELANRSRAEEELRAKGYILSESQRIAHIGSWNWDLATGTLTWTPETYRLHGVSPDTFVPSRETLPGLIHPDDRAAMQTWLVACRAGEEPPDLEFRASLPDGGVRNILARGHLVRDAENEPIRMVGVAQDVTDRRRAEEEVRRANEKLSTLVRKLEIRGVRESVLSEMHAFLQGCSSTLEIGPVVAHSMRRLFPDADGALFLLSPSKTDLETAVRWGDFPEEPDENVFSPDACWGLRRGCLHVVDDVSSGLICPHMRHLAATAYACIPLTAKSEVLGLLHVRSRSAEAHEMTAALEGISSMLSEVLSLSISNLRLSETLRVQSIRDPLTGLFNRRYLEETLQREIFRAARNQSQIGVAMADIDHFKTFNDLHGHAAGDLVLTELAAFLRKRMRGVDIACRYGGEEFTLVFIESSLEDTVVRCNELKREVKELKFRCAGQEIGPITLSLGVSVYPADGPKIEDLLRAADAALYQAKQVGRDRVVSAGTRADRMTV